MWKGFRVGDKACKAALPPRTAVGPPAGLLSASVPVPGPPGLGDIIPSLYADGLRLCQGMMHGDRFTLIVSADASGSFF